MNTASVLHLHGDLFSWHSAVSWLAGGLVLLAYAYGRLVTRRRAKDAARRQLPDLTRVVTRVPGKVKIEGEVYVVEAVTVHHNSERSIQIELSHFTAWHARNQLPRDQITP